MNKNNLYNKAFFLIIFLIVSFQGFCTESSFTNTLKNDENKTINQQLKFKSGIRSIFHDSQGNYWFGSHDQGVAIYDGEKFRYFTTKDGLSHNQIRTIQENEDGSIWFGTGNGVSSFDGKRIQKHELSKNPSGFELNSLDIPSSISDKDLWFNAGIQSGIYRLQNQKISYVDFPIPGDINKNVYSTTGHTKSKNSYVWIASFSAVFGYDGYKFTIIDDQSLVDTKQINLLHIRSILEDSKGNLWIGNNGIGVLLKSGDSIINFSDENGLIHANSKGAGDVSPAGTLEHVFVIEEDNSGNIWFGDRDTGVWKYDGNKMTNYARKNGLSTNGVGSIHIDQNGDVWIGLMDGSVYLFNGQTFDRKFSTY